MTDSTAAGTREPPRLHCCQGQPPPEPVLRGWARLQALHTSAQQAFVEVLVASIVEADEGALASSLSAFSEDQGVEAEAAFAALKACQFLLQRAAALNLPPERFAEDLQALSPDDAGGLRLVASRYEPLKQQIRRRLLVESLADHGKVLVGLDWRVDRVGSSDRAVELDAAVVYLTLKLRSAEGTERVSVQLTPESVQMLCRFCQRFDGG